MSIDPGRPGGVSAAPLAAIDLETTRKGAFISMGAVLSGKPFFTQEEGEAVRFASGLVRRGARLVGHNLFGFDLPWLVDHGADPGLLALPLLDTLFLSPLAFPANPYHRLVKGYKIVTDVMNDPVHDASLSLALLKEEIAALRERPPVLLRFFAAAFSGARVPGGEGFALGMGRLFRNIAPAAPEGGSGQELLDYLAPFACPTRLKEAFRDAAGDPEAALCLAYVAAWLPFSGANSILPAWVRRKWPGIDGLVHSLRGEPCGNPCCPYCRELHNPVAQLQRWFGFEGFRALPDGRRLQEDIVRFAMEDRSLLAILPTGGGKSLCYQLPALVRNERDASLTVVVSPLQALMKDQVDNLAQKTGTASAAALCGLLTGPERGQVMDRVVSGDVAILYISPEQLRNPGVKRVLMMRRIGCWVFDEAHCLSKWGHDFRPDYLYCVRVIRELSDACGTTPPPVQAFTATARPDVIRDITECFKPVLPEGFTLFQGGVERTNLEFSVLCVSEQEKSAALLDLLRRELADPQACAIVYCATTKACDFTAAFLEQMLPEAKAAAFYARLDPEKKKAIIEAFIGNELRVICATNAFGMGIDKGNVRLVVHYEIPGSLESYLQEAGRAGRDLRPARCVLLYDPKDIDKQFQLSALSELSLESMNTVLRSLKRRTEQLIVARAAAGRSEKLSAAQRKAIVEATPVEKYPEVVDTVMELLGAADPGDAAQFDLDPVTKVRTAIAWLECAGFMTRSDNSTQVFQGVPRFKSAGEACKKIEELSLNPAARSLWRAIALAMVERQGEATPRGASADGLSEKVGEWLPANEASRVTARDVMRAVSGMERAGLLSRAVLISLVLRPSGARSAGKLAELVLGTEARFLDLLIDEAPQADDGAEHPMDLRAAAQKLRDMGEAVTGTALLRNILVTWREDGASAGGPGMVSLRSAGRDRFMMRLTRGWQELRFAMQRRHRLARLLLEFIKTELAGRAGSVQDEYVSFPLEKLVGAIAASQDFAGWTPEKCEKAAGRSLLFLHEQKVLCLQSGLALFRQAMTMRLTADRKRAYTRQDFSELASHYEEKNAQIHFMNEYAGLGAKSMGFAMRYAADYFALSEEEFEARYFKGRKQELARGSSAATYRRILTDLANKEQEAVVSAARAANQLVIAGPGSGKSKVILHRAAWLASVKRVNPREILVLCYNHSTAVSLRKRLVDLMGEAGRRITVRTFHSFALSLTGRSVGAAGWEEADLSAVIREAADLLTGRKAVPGLGLREQREELLMGLKYLLVDEYQDIDEGQYEFIAAMVGKFAPEDDVKMSLTAAGDDDQAIYGFRNASIAYIRRFEEDYKAQRRFLTYNYRSTRAIIEASNALIEGNTERLKAGHPGRIDPARELEPEGGLWEGIDETQGRVTLLDAEGAGHQAALAAAAVKDILEKDRSAKPADIAVLARNGLSCAELAAVRSAFEDEAIPVRRPLPRESGFTVGRVLEVVRFREALQAEGERLIDGKRLLELVPEGEGFWSVWLRESAAAWAEAGAALPARWILQELDEMLAEERRSIRFGTGVLLSTVHGVKGEEFRYVLLLDGGWDRAASGPRPLQEEERRLYYVGMTRARDRLLVFRRGDCRNPFIPAFASLSALSSLRAEAPRDFRTYDFLGMADLWLGWAGLQPEKSPANRALSELRCGEGVRLVAEGARVAVFTAGGVKVAMLSRKASEKWRALLPRVKEARVAAVLLRGRKDEDEGESGVAAPPGAPDQWRFPVMEVTLSHEAAVADLSGKDAGGEKAEPASSAKAPEDEKGAG